MRHSLRKFIEVTEKLVPNGNSNTMNPGLIKSFSFPNESVATLHLFQLAARSIQYLLSSVAMIAVLLSGLSLVALNININVRTFQETKFIVLCF